MNRSTVLTIDGIDGSGKATLSQMVEDHLLSLGHSVVSVDFPRYETTTGKAISEYLHNGYCQSNNRTGAAVLYSADRCRYWMENFYDICNGDYEYIILNRNWLSNVFFHTALLTAKADELDQVEPKYKLSSWMPPMTLVEWYHLLTTIGLLKTDRLWSEDYMSEFMSSLQLNTKDDGIRNGLINTMRMAVAGTISPYDYLTTTSTTTAVEYTDPWTGKVDKWQVRRYLVYEDWNTILQSYMKMRIARVQIMMMTMFMAEIMPWFETPDSRDIEFRTVVLSSSRPSHSEKLFHDNLLKRYNGDVSKLDVHEKSNDYLGSVVENVAFIRENLSKILALDGIFNIMPTSIGGMSKYFTFDIVNIDRSYDDPSLRSIDDEFSEILQKLRLF